MRLERGTVVLVSLDPVVGHEQQGMHPCVVVSDPDITDDQRFPLLCVVPVTRTPGEGALYPLLLPGSSGLRRSSTALVDQVRAIDKKRIHSVFGTLAPAELAAIDEGLILFLGLLSSST